MTGQITSATAEKKDKRSIEWRNYTSAIGLVILVAISCIFTSSFLTALNLVNVLKQIVVPTCLAVGMTYVILLGGIDLSVGSVIALMATCTGLLLQSGINWVIAVIIILAAGGILGAFHGILVARFDIPPFIATLAGYTAYKGLALLITNSSAIKITEPTFLAISSKNVPNVITIAAAILVILLLVVRIVSRCKTETYKKKIIAGGILKIIGILVVLYVFLIYGGMPVSVAIAAVLFSIFTFILSCTVFGAEVYAIGGNMSAAKLAGISVRSRIIMVYAITTFCAAVGAVLTASRLGSGAPQSGLLSEMDAIAAVVIGGTSMKGGIGKLGGTILGVCLIGVLNNMLSLLGASTYTQQILKGVIILIAVMLDMQLSKADTK